MRNPAPNEQSAAPESRAGDPGRRRFLFTLGAGGAGAAVAVAGALPAAAAPVTAAPAGDEDAAYRATEHVRDYYRTARI